MPQRSNDFQSLITKIQAALHGRKAKIEESAMVYNYDTGKDTEIDILVTFVLGATKYRTGVECQDRSRPAGSPWIAELKSKRDGCRIDKIIAVHSKGFSDGAANLAEKYGIELIVPNESLEIDWLERFKVFTSLCFQMVKCKLRNNHLDFNLLGEKISNKIEADGLISLPGQPDVEIAYFVDQIKECIKYVYREKYDLTNKSLSDYKDRSISITSDVFLTFSEGAIFKPTAGGSLSLVSAGGVADITIETKIINELRHIKHNEEVLATHADFEFMGNRTTITLTDTGNEKEFGFCASMDGGKFSDSNDNNTRIPGLKIFVKDRNCKIK